MSKKTSDSELEIARIANGSRTPPLLSEKLIAKLQGAVEAARRKRRTLNTRTTPTMTHPLKSRGRE
jgi:hypothetical protein